MVDDVLRIRYFDPQSDEIRDVNLVLAESLARFDILTTSKSFSLIYDLVKSIIEAS